MAASKPTLVRIKRKRCEAPLDLLWLQEETKRRHLDAGLADLSLLDHAEGKSKLLFRRLQTVEASQVKDASLAESLMSELTASRTPSTSTSKQGERKSAFKSVKAPSKSSQAARQQHEREWKRARYKQVWKNRLCAEPEDVMPQFFRLYDVVRTDDQEARESGAGSELLLKKYMPLLQELYPDKFAMEDQTVSNDDFVYDVYAQQEDHEADEDDEADVLTLRVSDTFAFGVEEERDSDYDSEDSNREDRPECDYPDEDDGECYGDEEDDSSNEDKSEHDGEPVWKPRR